MQGTKWLRWLLCFGESIYLLSISALVLQFFRPNDPFQSSVAFHIKTSYLNCTVNNLTGFYMKCSTGLYTAKMLHEIWSFFIAFSINLLLYLFILLLVQVWCQYYAKQYKKILVHWNIVVFIFMTWKLYLWNQFWMLIAAVYILY